MTGALSIEPLGPLNFDPEPVAPILAGDAFGALQNVEPLRLEWGVDRRVLFIKCNVC